MKLLFLHRDLPPDSFTGVATQVHRLANALVDLGHEVMVLTQSALPADARYQVRAIESKLLSAAMRCFPVCKRIWYPLRYRNLKMTGWDAVHVHGDGAFLRYRGNFVRTFYGTAALEFRHARSWKGKLAQGFSYWMERREARRCRLSVGISPHVAAHLPGIDRVVPCLLESAPNAAPLVKTNHPSLIFIGSRYSRKRGEAALEIFGRLRKSNPGLTLAYVGPKPEVELLRREGGNAGVEFHTQLPGSELAALYARSWVYLCLSSYEGFGVGIIEAMASACVVVTTPHPGSEFLVRDGDTGIIAPLESMEAAVRAVLADAKVCAEFGRRAQAFAQRFTPMAVASAYEDLYRITRARIQERPT